MPAVAAVVFAAWFAPFAGLSVPHKQDDLLRQALEKAGRHLAEYRKDLKSFICQETVRSETWRKQGGPRTIHRARFEFRVSGESEERIPLAGDAQQIPFFLQGGYISALYGLLGTENQSLYDFQIVEQNELSRTLTVQTVVPREHSRTILESDFGPLAVGYQARIVIDLENGHVQSVERQLAPIGDIIELTHLVVFDQIEAAGEDFILPVLQETRVTRQGGLRYLTLHRYRDYKRFSTSATVKYR